MTARVNAATGQPEDEDFLSPIFAPKIPDRLYFVFQEPIAVDAAMSGDREACEQVRCISVYPCWL